MALAGMLNKDESAVICDLAETYRIYDYRKYDADYIAILVTGLRADSRIMKKYSGVKIDTIPLLLTRIFDQLNILLWMNTVDGQNNRNQPKSLVETIVGSSSDDTDIVSFDTAEQFEIERQKILKGVA